MKSENYWQEKISVWLHDPICKPFSIQEHEKIASQIAEKLIQPTPDKARYGVADQIASGLTRASLPPYSPNANENGAIDFKNSPFITHPLVSGKNIKLDLPDVDLEKLVADIKNLLNNDLGLDKTYEEMKKIPEAQRPLNGFSNKQSTPETWAENLFNYLFFAFSKRLRNDNIGNLGALWDVLPADTRMPDHALWHHLGLTSAIYSSMSCSQKNEASMVVFTITPVQDFISKARKLRDYWTGSVILSYLAFVGIKTVMKELGADHVVYPSLQNQFLVEQWLGKEFHLERFLEEKDKVLNNLNKNSSSIASFPNKFVFICANEDVEDICKKIENEIQAEWKNTSNIVKNMVKTNSKIESDNSYFSKIWDKTVDNFWNYSWASANLLSIKDEDVIKDLLGETKWKTEFETLSEFKKQYNSVFSTARMYGTTHSLVQSVLAAGKMKNIKMKPEQNGEKCPLCGEHEVLNDFDYSGKSSAKDYSSAVREFWDNLRKSLNPENSNAQIGKNERLCAVCSVKRFLPIAIGKNHTLYKTLKNEEFPSTTEMSAFEYLQTINDEKKKNDIINKLHSNELDTEDTTIEFSKNYETKYYAVLLMDGDKMGELINGNTLSAKWKDVLNPDLIKRLESSSFIGKSVFKDLKWRDKARIINPALHSAISDSLNNFARYSVHPIICKAGGKLIYTGGDDVCAVLPLSTSYKAAKDISKAYNLNFAEPSVNGAVEFELAQGKKNGSKILLHLGNGADGISISGALVIAHHKQPLKEVINSAHSILDGIAKNKSGRNSLAICLKKRSGGDRTTYFKWNQKNPFAEDGRTLADSFMKIVDFAKDRKLSSSLLYKIENLRLSLEPALYKDVKRDVVVNLFEYEIAHSGLGKDIDARDIAIDMAGLCVKTDRLTTEDWFNPEAAIIANFLAGGDLV